MSRHAYGLPFGAELRADGVHTRFRLHAPAQRAVALLLDDGPPQPMRRDAAGDFDLETVAPPGSRYRYRLDDGLAVPDPAARAGRRRARREPGRRSARLSLAPRRLARPALARDRAL
nr:hypothetical protein [Solimonas variicoloris]